MIYLIFDKLTKLTKIGHSVNPFKRFNGIKIGNPNVVLVYYSNNYSEKELHEKFDEKRVSGEWFKLTLSDYKEIIGNIPGLPKSLYYRNGIPKFISETKDYLKTTPRKKIYNEWYHNIKFLIKDYPFYFIDDQNKVRNIETGKVLQMQLKGYTRGYYFNGKFLSLKQIRPLLVKYKCEKLPF